MEAGSAFDGGAFVGASDASSGDDVLQLLDRADVFVGEWLVDQLPRRFGRLQFRRVGRRKDQAHAVWNVEPRFPVPSGVVEDEKDGSIASRAGLAREGGEQRLEKLFRDAIVHIPERLSRRGRDEGGDVEPVETMMAKRDRTLADRRPNAPRNGLQAEAMFVGREDFDGSAGVFFRFLDDGVRKLFLNAAASSGVADFGFFVSIGVEN